LRGKWINANRIATMPRTLLALLIITLATGCTTPTNNSASADYALSEAEQKALGQGFVQLFAGDLPNYAYDAKIFVESDVSTVVDKIKSSITRYGKVSEAGSRDGYQYVHGRVGSGSMNMNPAGLLAKVEPFNNGALVSIRAVAKEGVVKQNTSGKAVERLITDIETINARKVQRQ
jgi:hypothetical protein